MKTDPSPMPQKGSSPQDDDKADYMRWAGVGIEFCGVLGIFCYLGYRLDEALNTSPWLLVVGFFMGFAGMLYILIKQAWPTQRK